MDNENFGSQIPPVEPKAQSASPLNKGLIVGLSAGIVILLAAVIYLLTAKQAVSPVVDNSNQIKNQEEENQNPTPSRQAYKNSEYGFELEFSDAWKGFKVFSSEGSQGVGHPTYLQFSMPTSDKTKCVQSVTDNVCGYAQIFEITIFDKDIWGQMSADQKRFGQVLGESSESIYIYGTRPVELPRDLENTNFDVPKIISTFKLISQNETAGWKTYSNTMSKVEFKYPSNFQVITDRVHTTYGNGTQWHRFEMRDNSSQQQPYMIFETNPDGYGPFFPSLVYKLNETADGSLQIVSKEKQSGEYVSETSILIVVQPLASQNGNSYSWRFDYKAGLTDYETIFDKILSTFKFTN